jgi:6-phosphofructokinase 1
MDPTTGRMRVRMVDTTSDRYRIGRAFTVRLRTRDLDHAATLAGMAAVVKLTPEAFRARFERVAVA